MIALSLEVVAEIVGGRIEGTDEGRGDGVVVTGPVVIDGREAGPGSLFVAFVGEHTDGHEHTAQAAANGAVAVLGTRATELPTVLVEDPQTALGRLAAYVVAQVRRDERLTVLAVTGSQGKTSTKDLLAAVLADAGPTVATHGSFNNELGMPLTALRVEPETRYLLLEMGARGRGHLTELTDLVAPDVSIVLNVGTAHLGEFGSRDAIAEAKGELVAALRTDGVAVLNADDARVAAMTSLHAGAGADVRDRRRRRRPARGPGARPSRTARVSRSRRKDARAEVELQLVGAHQATNAAAAAAAGRRRRSRARGRRGLALPGGVAVEVADGAPRAARAASCSSTTPTTPTPSRCGPRSTRWSRSVRTPRSVVPSPSSARCASSATTATRRHRDLGEYAAARVDQLLVIGADARGIHDGAGGRSVFVDDNAGSGRVAPREPRRG